MFYQGIHLLFSCQVCSAVHVVSPGHRICFSQNELIPIQSDKGHWHLSSHTLWLSPPMLPI